MKREVIFILTVLLVIVMAGQALALTDPFVAKDHGVVTGMIVSSDGLSITGEYGLKRDLAVIATLGDPITRLGVKYELGNTYSLVGGLTENSPFIGLNGAYALADDVTSIYELDLAVPGSELSLMYELGVKIDIDQAVDLRAGILGFVENNRFPHLQVGVGYQF